MHSQFSAKNKRRYNDDDNTESHQQIVPPKKHPHSRPSQWCDQQLNSCFILDMMRENDTLTIKRTVAPRAYFDILISHQENTHCKVVRVEALASAIPNLIRVCELVQLCDLATIVKISTKPRRMKVGVDSDLTL